MPFPIGCRQDVPRVVVGVALMAAVSPCHKRHPAPRVCLEACGVAHAVRRAGEVSGRVVGKRLATALRRGHGCPAP